MKGYRRGGTRREIIFGEDMTKIIPLLRWRSRNSRGTARSRAGLSGEPGAAIKDSADRLDFPAGVHPCCQLFLKFGHFQFQVAQFFRIGLRDGFLGMLASRYQARLPIPVGTGVCLGAAGLFTFRIATTFNGFSKQFPHWAVLPAILLPTKWLVREDYTGPCKLLVLKTSMLAARISS